MCELLDVRSVKAGGVGQPESGALPQPQRARAEAQRGHGLDQRHLGRLDDVERAAHRGDDCREPEELAFARAMLRVEMLEVPADDACREPFDHILET